MPRVASPWQTSRAPPWSSTSAMWSGERKPSGGEWSVVKVTISPRPVREPAAERGLAVEGGAPGGAGREEAGVLERDQLERSECVVHLRDLHAVGAEARHRERRLGGGLGRPEARQLPTVADGERIGALPDSGDPHGRAAGRQHERGGAVGDG